MILVSMLFKSKLTSAKVESHILRRLAILYLIALAFFGWGAAAARYGVFPWSLISPTEKQIVAFVKGHDEEDTTLLKKILNDVGITPSRQMMEFIPSDERSYRRVKIDGLKVRRNAPVVFSGKKQARGYRFIFGTFDFIDHLHGAVLFDQDNNVIHRWIVNDHDRQRLIDAENVKNQTFRRELKPSFEAFPHGVEIFNDGSIIFNDGDSGDAVQKISVCGESVWTTLGGFHHVVQRDENDNSIWVGGAWTRLEQSQPRKW